MAERRTIIDGKGIDYTGLISIQGIYRLIKERLDDLGYGPYEEYHSQQVFEDGKEILITLKGDNKLSDYAKVEWKTKFAFTNCQEVVIEKNNQKVKMHKGTVSLSTTIFLSTDHDKSFEQNAFQYFLRAVIDKFIFKSYITKAGDKAKKDYSRLENDVKSYLNFERID